MNALKNKVQLIGNLGNTPEVTILESGKKVAKFSIATNETYTNAKGEKITNTEWHQIIAWNKTADIIEQFLQKGSEAIVEGKLTTRSYTDSNAQKRYFTEIICSEILVLGNK
ncbi:single-stranded DNA-binding protein [Tenacibaculum sp. SG-28]|uniref:single-stranded DNA-binding protein n=1 Tax=Tenacibaculum sp. SG-28 TaxID=754426 RepID=UPI000CF526E8|nr:single-stranded DNA-binding protein [Tenacibaculum sp. SG-28]PQJ21233.1 single-stranded DNA-binding protein [Tenacibaculum sp. SG-28]